MPRAKWLVLKAKGERVELWSLADLRIRQRPSKSHADGC